MATVIKYGGNLNWLIPRTIYYAVRGSHAYGTNLKDSDTDYGGICVPPQRYRDGFLDKFEQCEHKGEPDWVIYDVRKFFKLASDANPNIIELLWVNDDDLLICTRAGEYLRQHRDDFLSKKVLHTFCGYAHQQLHRIRVHRRWLMSPIEKRPLRVDFGLKSHHEISKTKIEAAFSIVQRKIDSWEIDFSTLEDAEKINVQRKIVDFLAEIQIGNDEKFNAAARLLGYNENFIDLIARERQYLNAVTEHKQYQNWKKTRNVKRAALEKKYGMDTKHAMHLVRLLRMCREILVDGVVCVKRSDAKELLEIRNGAWSYDRLIKWADDQEKDLIEVAKTSSLPHSPDRKMLDDICIGVIDMVEH